MSSSSNTEELGVRLSALGVPEFTNGMGLGGKSVEDFGKKADGAAPQLDNTTAALARSGKTAKETAQAWRLLPAQITDVVTSLASGQPAWLIAIQQGGQIKDSFGGIGPMFRELAGAIGPARLALGGAAAAAAGLVLAHSQGASEAQAYAKALILSGNAAGTSAGQMGDMARAISQTVGTQGKAAEGLALMAASGEVASRHLQGFTDLAIRMERTLDAPLAETAQKFTDLGRAPLEASLKLNRGTNFLTAAIYDQIKALMEQGREAEAGAVAQKAFADAMSERTNKVTQNLGLLERAWTGVKDASKWSWDVMLDIGREDTLEQKLAKAKTTIERFRALPNQGGGGLLGLWETSRYEAAQKEVAAINRDMLRGVEGTSGDAAAAQAAKDYIAAREANDKWTEAALTNAARRDRELKRYRDNNATLQRGGAVVDPAQVSREEAAIAAKYADVKPIKPRAEAGDPYRALNDEITRRLALADGELAAGAKLSEADRVRIELMQRLTEAQARSGTPQQAGDAAVIDYLAARTAAVEAQRTAAAAAAEAERKTTQERTSAANAAQHETDALTRQRDALMQETAELGLSAAAIQQRRHALDEAAIAAKEDRLARIEGLPAYTAEAEALRAQIKLQREMLGLRAERAGKTQAIADQKEQDADNKQRSEALGKSIEEGLLKGFREGHSLADVFFRELQAQALRTILKVPVQMMSEGMNSVIGTVLQGIGSVLGAYSGTGQGINNGTGLMPTAGGKASGGGVMRGSLQEVNEQGPELLSVNNRTYLMMGGKDGFVTPNTSGSSGGKASAAGGGMVVHFAPNVTIEARTDSAQIATLVQSAMRSAQAELLDMMDRGQA